MFMRRVITTVSLLVPDYDEAIAHYCSDLGFSLIEDTPLTPEKRWVRIAPAPDSETCLLLARAASEVQKAAIGAQSGGRVFLFLRTDDFARDHAAFKARGVRFLEAPRRESYGIVAIFEDRFGNRWDLIEETTADAQEA
jgi:catechol 2,3-dioxygenase-like lactoylglutathione lyase family enzyme